MRKIILLLLLTILLAFNIRPPIKKYEIIFAESLFNVPIAGNAKIIKLIVDYPTQFELGRVQVWNEPVEDGVTFPRMRTLPGGYIYIELEIKKEDVPVLLINHPNWNTLTWDESIVEAFDFKYFSLKYNVDTYYYWIGPTAKSRIYSNEGKPYIYNSFRGFDFIVSRHFLGKRKVYMTAHFTEWEWENFEKALQ